MNMKRLTALVLVLAWLCFAGLAEDMMRTANPWTLTTAEELMQTLGVEFGVPEDAENVVYRMLESENLAEMQFGWRDAEYSARIKPAAVFEDISGFYYRWNAEETCEIGWCEGRIMRTDEATVCLWYDAAPGLMYSVGTVAPADAEVDIRALAEMIYIPTQGEVEQKSTLNGCFFDAPAAFSAIFEIWVPARLRTASPRRWRDG